jgi:hypothetical protein
MNDRDSQTSFSDVLSSLIAGGRTASKDPHRTRLAAVTTAIVEVARSPESNDSTSCSASQVYAKAVTALEGTIQQDADEQTWATQAALLELLDMTIGHVAPAAILVATLQVTSRVLRALVALSRDIVEKAGSEPRGSGREGGPNAVLRWTCRVTARLLLGVAQCPSVRQVDEATVKLLLGDTLFALLDDRRPKVRKAAQGALVELLHVDESSRAPRNSYLAAVKKSVNAYCHTKLVAARRDFDSSDAVHTLAFLESAIPFLDCNKLGSDIMELFAVLVKEKHEAGSAEYVALSKVQASTPKVLTMCAILSTISAVLREPMDAIGQLAPRVLASLLQVNPALVFRTGSAEYEVLQRSRTLFGQALVGACTAVAQANPDLACKLVPVSMQLVAILARPPDDHPDDATCAEAIMVDLVEFIRSHLSDLDRSSSPTIAKCLEDTVKAMMKVLDTLYRPTWSSTLNAFVVLLLHVHPKVDVVGSVRALLELRNQVSPGSASQRAVQEAFSSLVQGAGIGQCWDWVEWQHKNANGTSNPGTRHVRMLGAQVTFGT